MPISVDELRTLGNQAVLELPKTAFFCSREYPAAIERATYLWAMEQRMNRHCVLSGFHSKLEQTVLRYLRQDGNHPIAYALGRGIQSGLAFEYERELTTGQLLFLSPFETNVAIVTKETVAIRNLLLADLADDFFVPYVTPNGNLEQLLANPLAQNKPILTLDLPANRYLLDLGAEVYQPNLLLSSHDSWLLGGPTLPNGPAN
ncbi:hypothetical protein [Hymenobacter sp. AT01-02]|uniref:hypothetical protein n=1 Tax=Hymenobacter sp. AT01-02 TaxID=1571877 RepID=UPI00069651C6|nr:hypothetical protein [Hymenobacter sp. AT01-02]